MAVALSIPWLVGVGVLFTTFALANPPAVEEKVEVEVEDLRARLGDRAPTSISADTSKEQGWMPASEFFRRHQRGEGVFWLAADVVVQDPTARLLRFSMLGSTEVYWNGKLVARGGTVGARREDELPGPLTVQALLPDFEPGRHRLEARVSNFYAGERRRFYGVEFVDPARWVGPSWRLHLLPALLFGVLFATGCHFLVVGLPRQPTDPRRDGEESGAASPSSDTLLGGLCLAAAALVAVENARAVVNYSYVWHFPRLQLIAGLTAVCALLAIAFLARRLALPRRRTLAIGLGCLLGVCAVLPVGYDGRTLAMWTSTLLVGLGLAGWAVWRGGARRRDGAVALAVILASLAILALDAFRFQDDAVFKILTALALAGMGIASVQRREKQRRVGLRAARLESQLLQRTLQPHFLLNTLTSVLEWIELEPQRAALFVEDLAAEFRLLSTIAGEPTISLADELRLCRLHLRIMAFRQGRAHRLETVGIDPEASVPPAIFHTLLENALTHNRYDDAITFRLEATSQDDGWIYRFDAPRGRQASEGPDPSTARSTRRTSTGLRLLEARLEAAFGRWYRLRAEPSDGTWTTVIEMGTRPRRR
ncbi:MAG: sensor histidine kinase [Acidobacteriota bacterium]